HVPGSIPGQVSSFSNPVTKKCGWWFWGHKFQLDPIDDESRVVTMSVALATAPKAIRGTVQGISIFLHLLGSGSFGFGLAFVATLLITGYFGISQSAFAPIWIILSLVF